ncbi:hypothetical protein [Alteromonas mediterranea]|uniref:Uncharacterized protein n=1 Tax=Alteromonas mediterranea TaxID=314275 RepID=A0AAC9ADG1_9ALTE|nr:hypothetical protein [Alteromonas mediterranea]AFV85995.1 hypothetical protein amad1_12475 [Alteromonas mediterranea DE1]AGP98006.1 hypothetical protein I635_12455 [Alteromonas mediterranea UM7]AGQ02265.1 hypothetical protein I636_12090 [Alteromonas mediterranea UM4b]AMJ79013.1 hypothetical protein AV942_12270 [Alteromonas mediterranea]AMJ83159.1 hypothetical protein AV941_12295 [Alteromonas mediterranea]
MPIYTPTKTTLQKIKKEAKKLDKSLGSLQQRQDIVSQNFGYRNYYDFDQAYKKASFIISGSPFSGTGSFSGEILLEGRDGLTHQPYMRTVRVEEYEITQRFELESNDSIDSSMQQFCEYIDSHLRDFASLIFKARDEHRKINPYSDFIELKSDYNLRSVDIVVGVEFPKGLSTQEEFKFAEKWFFDEGKGGRISLSNLPNDGLIPAKAIPTFLRNIRTIAEQSFKQGCYVFPSSIHQDLTCDETQLNRYSH